MKCCNSCGDELVPTAAGACLVLVCVPCEQFYVTGDISPLDNSLPEIPCITQLHNTCITFTQPKEKSCET